MNRLAPWFSTVSVVSLNTISRPSIDSPNDSRSWGDTNSLYLVVGVEGGVYV